MNTNGRGIMHVAGQARRGPDGYTILVIHDKEYVLSRHYASNLLRFSWTAYIIPDGRISPAKSGYFGVHIPGEGEFLINADDFRKTVTPNGGRKFARIYEKPNYFYGRK